MTSLALDLEPACPTPSDAVTSPAGPALRVERRGVAGIDRSTWDGLAARTPWATPFSGWAFQRAWWEAYGANARDETVVLVPADAGPNAPPVAIVPLMGRHGSEPTDPIVHTTMRHAVGAELTPIPDAAAAIFFGASYHADYATVLADPADLAAASDALVDWLADDPVGPAWDVVDLRRLRCGDPAADALAAAFGAREIASGWTLNLEAEDVCPVVTLPPGGAIEDVVAALGKKDRHEIRRKVRRADATGGIRLEESMAPLDDLEAFIDLHQRRWGVDGLFPDTPGGDQSRVFMRRLFEIQGADGPFRLAFLSCGPRRIAAGMHAIDGDRLLFYNAGIDPDARDLSPGVVMVYAYIELALSRGWRVLDFLRGDEPYKYEWGAADEPIQRLLVRRTGR